MTTDKFGFFKRLKIRTKLIIIVSLVIISALTVMTVIATVFFKNDMQRTIETNNNRTTSIISQKVESDLFSIADKLNLMASAMNQEFKSEEQKYLFAKNFFTNDNTLLYLAIIRKTDDNKLIVTRSIENRDFMQNNQVSIDDFNRINQEFSDSYLRAFSNEFMVFNVSRGFKNPVLAVSFPFKKNGNGEVESTLACYIKLERFLPSFAQTSDSTTTYMVNGDGEVLAHHDAAIVLNHGNFIKSPIVQQMLKSKSPNSTIRYSDSGKKTYLGSFSKIGFGGIGIIATIEENKAFEGVYAIQRINIYILGITLSVAILFVYFFAKTFSTPLLKLLHATNEIEKGNFRVEIKPSSGDEIGQLTGSFVHMGLGLEEREKVKNILGNMVDPVVVNEAMKDLGALKRGSEKEITAFFSDVASFSTISEKLQSADLASLLNEYLSSMTIILKQYDGVLDKYIGDAIVGIFNAPVDVADHQTKACLASIDMIAKLHDLRTFWKSKNAYIPEAREMDIRIGLNTGPAKVGFMGTDALASYTMMGDTVNLAARLEAAGKDYGTNILITEMIKDNTGGTCFTRELDLVRVKGKNEPVKLYELICRKTDATQNLIDHVKFYEEGFRLYLAREWDSAIAKLSESEKAKGRKDKSARMLAERCELYKITPPDSAWDGVFTRTHK